VSTLAELEQEVRQRRLDQDVRGAVQRVLEVLGADVVRVIHARFAREEATAEVFSRFAEDLLRGLPQFDFRCPLRAWVFMLARNAGNRYLDRDLRRERRNRPLSDAPELLLAVDALRTKTMPLIDTEREQRLAALRAELREPDQLLLMLRIDRELDFLEMALVFLGDERASEEELAREAARLRKRFQLVKQRLRKRWSQ